MERLETRLASTEKVIEAALEALKKELKPFVGFDFYLQADALSGIDIEFYLCEDNDDSERRHLGDCLEVIRENGMLTGASFKALETPFVMPVPTYYQG